MLACPHHRCETCTTIWGVGSRHFSPSPPERRAMGRIWPHHPSMRPRDGGHDASPTGKTRGRHPSSHVPVRAERPTLDSHTLPLSRNETVRPRDRAQSRPLRQRPLNGKTLSDRLTPLTVPQRTTNPPEHPVERSKHNSQTNTEENDTRIDDEPLHHEAHGTSASVTTTRKPAPGPHATRVVERPRKWNTVAETHFQSNLSS